MVGLCAGAVSALFAAMSSSQCKGVIVMDPYFHLPLKRRSRLWQTLTGRISRSAPGRFISAAYDKIKDAWVFFRGETPPENANFPLLSAWKTLSANRLPMLVFRAPGTKCRGGEFDYLRYLLSKRRSREPALLLSRSTAPVILFRALSVVQRSGRKPSRGSMNIFR